jgi:hypothetical protein
VHTSSSTGKEASMSQQHQKRQTKRITNEVTKGDKEHAPKEEF